MKTFSFPTPPTYTTIFDLSKAMNFSMGSDLAVGSLLKTLVATKPRGNFLELGTETDLGTSWMIEGLSQKGGQLTSIDNDPKVVEIAQKHLQKDKRVQFHCTDAGEWISNYEGPSFDLILADAWPGKFSHLEQTLALLKVGGIYLIDDLLPQENWPTGHQEKVNALINTLTTQKGFSFTQLDWATGIVIMVKK